MRETKGHRADYNHLGRNSGNKSFARLCGCKNGPQCLVCERMICCSCQCHKVYSLRLRFHSEKDLQKLWHDIETYCGHPDEFIQQLSNAKEDDNADIHALRAYSRNDTSSVDEKSFHETSDDRMSFLGDILRSNTPNTQIGKPSLVTDVYYSTPVKMSFHV